MTTLVAILGVGLLFAAFGLVRREQRRDAECQSGAGDPERSACDGCPLRSEDSDSPAPERRVRGLGGAILRRPPGVGSTHDSAP